MFTSSFAKSDKGTTLYALMFIILYGSGYIGAKLGFPYANPLSFLDVRFLLSFFILLILSMFTRAKWPKTLKEVAHIAISGLFLIGIFSIGTWTSMDMGVPPATSALIIALQPLTIAIASHFLLHNPVDQKQWYGLVLGLIGVFLVVGEHASFNTHYLLGVMMSFLGLVGLTVGNIYQKTFCSNMNIITGGAIQSLASAIFCCILTVLFSHFQIKWTGEFIFALSWMSIVVSLGAISILYILLRRAELHKIASIYYLIPAVTAIIAYFVFGNVLNMLQITGMIIAMFGVALVNIRG